MSDPADFDRQRWNSEKGDWDVDHRVDRFLEDVVAVCRKHGMCLGHEDTHGAFQVHRRFDEGKIGWLIQAMIGD